MANLATATATNRAAVATLTTTNATLTMEMSSANATILLLYQRLAACTCPTNQQPPPKEANIGDEIHWNNAGTDGALYLQVPLSW